LSPNPRAAAANMLNPPSMGTDAAGGGGGGGTGVGAWAIREPAINTQNRVRQKERVVFMAVDLVGLRIDKT